MSKPRRPGLLARLATVPEHVVEQLDVIVARDPSTRSRSEAALHPAVAAILGHRIAHGLHRRGLRRTARALSTVARLVSGGVEIHPGARIGHRFFIDHGSGVVIGETAIIGDDVSLFHQVTLGSAGWWRDRERPAAQRRHPRLGNGVTVGVNATILGPVTIGDNALIGAQALVVSDVPNGAQVRAPAATVQQPRPRIARLDERRVASTTDGAA